MSKRRDPAVEAAMREATADRMREGEQYSESLVLDSDVRQGLGPKEARAAIMSTSERVPLYSTETGVMSEVSTDQLRFMLSKRFPPKHPMAGEYAFSDRQLVKPIVGTLLCFLHSRHPRREYFDSIGLAGKTCTKSNIVSEFDQERHAQKKHKTEWALIQRDRNEKREEEYRNFQRQQTEALVQLAHGGRIQAVQPEIIQSEIIQPVTVPKTQPRTKVCPDCGAGPFANLRWHTEAKHKVMSQVTSQGE